MLRILKTGLRCRKGRPQRYGTQCLDDPVDGRIRPWKLSDSEHVNEFRTEIGLRSSKPTQIISNAGENGDS